MKSVLALTSILTVGGLLAQAPNPLRGEASQPVEPYKVIGNIYYVGAVNISSHIIVTPEGLILLDTGTQEMLPGIRTNLAKLGYTLQDVKIILSSHAHWDHVEGHAAIKELSGATVMAVGEDAAAISSGIDNSAAGASGWNPTEVDRVLKDGDKVTLGGVTMQAHLTPGHTKGCTAWTTTVEEDGESYSVLFVGGTGINRNLGVKLLNNKRHPSIVEDYARTFRVLGSLEVDVFLAQHPSMYGMADKMERLKAGATPNPFIDPEGYQRFLKQEEGNYLKQLEEERAALR
jgi:metallo-beta-lactamase class B